MSNTSIFSSCRYICSWWKTSFFLFSVWYICINKKERNSLPFKSKVLRLLAKLNFDPNPKIWFSCFLSKKIKMWRFLLNSVTRNLKVGKRIDRIQKQEFWNGRFRRRGDQDRKMFPDAGSTLVMRRIDEVSKWI